ncbi:MAG TPA: AgmX/PglI C-terminal domain-containing protein, partial [Kofleriaceae bacterium]
IVGGLDKEIIKRYIKMNLNKVAFCYEHELLAHPTMEGTVEVQFFISPSGVVTSATGKGFDPTVSECVAGVVNRIQFPKPEDGGGVNVNYPFNFHATK